MDDTESILRKMRECDEERLRLWRACLADRAELIKGQCPEGKVLERLLRAPPQRTPENPKALDAYLNQSCRNGDVDEARRRQTHVRGVQEGPAPFTPADTHPPRKSLLEVNEDLARIMKYFEGEAPLDRAIVYLRLFIGAQLTEIAVIVGMNDSAVRQRYSRLLNRLKGALGPEEGEVTGLA